ncbi:MAG TPA: hypothetical protein VND64_07900 [Pirellulales bacterium]|nr:hypothetical protein [Pirellulales bacterium]
MGGILADVNIEGHVGAVLRVLESAPWRELWLVLDVPVRDFRSFGLAANVPDAVLWHFCQRNETVLITANRNRHGADSLESTIRAHNTAMSLPVLTLANPDAVLADRFYAERVASRLLDTLFDLDNLRGAGRLYLP